MDYGSCPFFFLKSNDTNQASRLVTQVQAFIHSNARVSVGTSTHNVGQEMLGYFLTQSELYYLLYILPDKPTEQSL